MTGVCFLHSITCMYGSPQLYKVFVFIFRRERHEIPLIVQTCIDEVERRGVYVLWRCVFVDVGVVTSSCSHSPVRHG